jgi:hypothetical protein
VAALELDKKTMDRNLRDDMLKLVRYKVLFVKRGCEHAFPECEALISENIDSTIFTAWKLAEFVQELGRGKIPVPHKWLEANYPPSEHVRDQQLISLPEGDKKYLKIYYEVLARYPVENLNYNEEQIRVLERIRAENKDKPDK